MSSIGLVLQGGGALGAYEYGAITCLVDAGLKPVAVTGVSIGAINAAAVAGARNGDIAQSLKELWSAITIPAVPFLTDHMQEMLSMFGTRNFYKLRTDILNMASWTSLCDVAPMRETLKRICDFDQINNPAHMRFAVTATHVAEGTSARFSNKETKITPDHILASGSLPPGFPMTQIEDKWYWDGGLFDNTPLRPMIDLLTPEEADWLPIVVIDLFPTSDAVPTNLIEIKNRMMEISFENKFWDDFGGPEGLVAYAQLLHDLDKELPASSALRQRGAFKHLMAYRCLKNLKVIRSLHVPMTGGMDFSAAGVGARFERGYQAAREFLASAEGASLQPQFPPQLRRAG
jgi:NTE family protein